MVLTNKFQNRAKYRVMIGSLKNISSLIKKTTLYTDPCWGINTADTVLFYPKYCYQAKEIVKRASPKNINNAVIEKFERTNHCHLEQRSNSLAHVAIIKPKLLSA